MGFRAASHAGSWYSGNRQTLALQLDQWLDRVPGTLEGLGSLPVPGARIIIAPYVQASAHPCSSHTDPRIPVMRDTATPDLAPPTPTRLWICPKRESIRSQEAS